MKKFEMKFGIFLSALMTSLLLGLTLGASVSRAQQVTDAGESSPGFPVVDGCNCNKRQSAAVIQTELDPSAYNYLDDSSFVKPAPEQKAPGTDTTQTPPGH